MKRLILLTGLLAAIFILPVSVGQDEPNVIEPNIIEPNIAEPNIPKQKGPMIQKTDLRVMVKQLEKRVDYLENRVEFLLWDNIGNKADIEELQSKLNIKPKSRKDTPGGTSRERGRGIDRLPSPQKRHGVKIN